MRKKKLFLNAEDEIYGSFIGFVLGERDLVAFLQKQNTLKQSFTL